MDIKKKKYATFWESLLRPKHIPFMIEATGSLSAIDNVTRGFILMVNQLDRVQQKYRHTSTAEERDQAYLTAVRNATLGKLDFLLISLAIGYVCVAVYTVRFF